MFVRHLGSCYDSLPPKKDSHEQLGEIHNDEELLHLNFPSVEL